MNHEDASLPALRHYIYARFAESGQPPATQEAAAHFGLSIARVEQAFEELAANHEIALAPGTHSVWMAHPFSGLPTNYTAQIGSKKYWGN